MIGKDEESTNEGFDSGGGLGYLRGQSGQQFFFSWEVSTRSIALALLPNPPVSSAWKDIRSSLQQYISLA